MVLNAWAAAGSRSWVFTNLRFPAQSCTSLPVDHADLGLLSPTAQPLCSFVAARLARRTCSPFLLAVLARRSSCSRRVFQRLRWSSAPFLQPLDLPASTLVKLTTSSSPHVLSRARQPTFCPQLASSASSPESFPASLVSSPASSPALSPASSLVVQPRLPHRSQARMSCWSPSC